MVKLDKIQISALAGKLTREINEKLNKKNIIISKEKEDFISKKIKKYPILQNLKTPNYARSIIVDKFKEELAQFDIMNNLVSQEQIREEIILSTIDNDSLDEIIKAITEKYSA